MEEEEEEDEDDIRKEQTKSRDTPVMFLDQRETSAAEVNTEMRKARELFVEELTPEIVERLNGAEWRRHFLEHAIDITPETKRIPNRPYYRMSHTEQEECKRQIEKYLNAGMIRPSKSPYGAAVLFAPKKNGKLRFCVDYRPLNEITIKNSVQPPDADDCLAQLSEASIFSTLDLAQGYHQIPIKERDKHKTAFNTKYGHFEWNSLCFGLTNAPATFVSGLNEIFSGNAYRTAEKWMQNMPNTTNEEGQQKAAEKLIGTMDKKALEERKVNLLDKFMTIYIDDIICWSKSAKEHAGHLRQIFDRLKDFDLLIQSPKSFFAMETVEYLGHEVSKKGIRAMDDKTALLKSWPTPTAVTDVRQFLGLCGYYRKFIQGYGQIAKPLSDLTKKEASDKSGKLNEGMWSEECQEAFELLRDLLCERPVLKVPDPVQGGFHIMCPVRCQHNGIRGDLVPKRRRRCNASMRIHVQSLETSRKKSVQRQQSHIRLGTQSTHVLIEEMAQIPGRTN
jgi:hypothetical protein